MATDAEEEAKLSERLLTTRQERGLTLAELAQRTGISPAHLSRLEKGIRQPSIASLLQLARAYDMTLGQLVGEPDRQPYHLVRASAEQSAVYRTESATYRILSGPGLPVSMAEVTIEPGRSSGFVEHPGIEWLYVLAGAIGVSIDGRTLALSEGDSVQFDASRRHEISVPGDEPARLLLASTTVALPSPHW